jgi:hypothetical protein
MTAAVIALPAPPETATDEEFEHLADLDAQGRDVMHAVRRLACPRLRTPDAAQELQDWWEEYCTAGRLRDRLAHGSEDWRDHYTAGDLTGYGSAQEAAADLMAQRADEARMAIAHGPRGGN